MPKLLGSLLMPLLCHPTWPPHTKLRYNFGNIEIFDYSYFAKLMTRKPKIGNLTNDRTLSISGVKKVVSAIQGDFVVTCDGRDATSKTKN